MKKKGTLNYKLEEIEYNNDYIDCDFVFDYCYTEAEKPVRYYSDGSGYPGAPEQIEIYDVVCTKVCFAEYDMVPDKVLVDEMMDIFWSNQEKIEEWALEKIYDSYIDDLSDKYDRD